MAGMKYDAPMPIQERCWEGCALDRDVLVVAPPGSGKTLAYILPAAHYARDNPLGCVLVAISQRFWVLGW